jgi:hypothetical protein
MVRPKPSHEKLRLAVFFANAVTRERIQSNDDCNLLIDRKGDTSIFNLICTCLPCFDSQQRDVVTEVQFNKHLVKCGYIPFRYRNRIRGTTDQWEKGLPRWKNRCWANPFNDDELTLIQSRLKALRDLFPDERISPEEIVKHLIAIVRQHIRESQVPRNHSQRFQCRLLLGEYAIKPCPALAFLRPEFAFLALSFYQVRMFAVLGRQMSSPESHFSLVQIHTTLFHCLLPCPHFFRCVILISSKK